MDISEREFDPQLVNRVAKTLEIVDGGDYEWVAKWAIHDVLQWQEDHS